MSQDELLNRMEDYTKVSDTIEAMEQGLLGVALVDQRDHPMELTDLLPDHDYADKIIKDLKAYQDDLCDQICKGLKERRTE